MYIAGLTKTTLLDYPEHVAATVFTGGCNFRCPFCHNGEFVLLGGDSVRNAGSGIPVEDVLAFLKKRANLLEGVCVSGGEPTIHRDLPEFLASIKELGYLVKLDTNGTNPGMLRGLIDGGLIDYAAMDVKNTWDKYAFTAGLSAEQNSADSLIKSVKQSVRLLLEGKIPYEFRTTVIRELHTKEALAGIAKAINGAQRYYIQSFQDSGNVLQKGCFTAYSKEELAEMTAQLTEPPAVLRGV